MIMMVRHAAEVAQEQRVQARYEAVPEQVRDNIGLAYAWAVGILMHKEGEGHHISVHAGDTEMVCGTIASPRGEIYNGRPMGEGSEAIVMVVCQYMEDQ